MLLLLFPLLLLAQQATHDRDENGCIVEEGLKEVATAPFPGDAIDIATQGPAVPSILFLIAASPQASNSIPNPESVEFGED